MYYKLSILIMIPLLFAMSRATSFTDMVYPTHNGTNIVENLDDTNLTSILSDTIAKWIISVQCIDECAERIFQEHMLQVVAQSLEPQGISVGKLNVSEECLTNHSLSAGGVYYINNGRVSQYNGYRDAETLLSFVKMSEQSPVQVIEGKSHKKAFDAVTALKIVGYFLPGSQELLEYESAAKANHPEVAFYSVIDPVVAPHLKLAVHGTIHVYKPYEGKNKRQEIPTRPATETDITSFLQTQGHSKLRVINKDNVHRLEDLNTNTSHVFALARQVTGEGYALTKLLKKTIRHGVNTTHLTVIMMDPDDFPVMADQWQAKLGIDINKPALGLVNLNQSLTRWLDLAAISLLNETDQELEIHQWLLQVEAGLYPIEPPVAPTPTPEPPKLMPAGCALVCPDHTVVLAEACAIQSSSDAPEPVAKVTEIVADIAINSQETGQQTSENTKQTMASDINTAEPTFVNDEPNGQQSGQSLDDGRIPTARDIVEDVIAAAETVADAAEEIRVESESQPANSNGRDPDIDENHMNPA